MKRIILIVAAIGILLPCLFSASANLFRSENIAAADGIQIDANQIDLYKNTAQAYRESTGADGPIEEGEIIDAAANRAIIEQLCAEYHITLTPEEKGYIADYHENTMRAIRSAAASENKMEREQAQETLDYYMQLIEDSGLTQKEYEEAARRQLAYQIKKGKLIDAQFGGSETDLQAYISGR